MMLLDNYKGSVDVRDMGYGGWGMGDAAPPTMKTFAKIGHNRKQNQLSERQHLCKQWIYHPQPH